MRLLITNDDGVDARGIYTLAQRLSKEHDVTIVAPKEQKSASSHAITLHMPIRVKEEKLEGLDCKVYSVVGTPADCTQMGLNLCEGKIDLVVSGINRGLNCGTDILYSGTVSAAIEGAIYGVPAIAVSMEVDWTREDEDYSKAAEWTAKIIREVGRDYLKGERVLNLNVPDQPMNKIKGIKVCKLGKSTYEGSYEITEENGEQIYTLKGLHKNIKVHDADLYYLSQGYVTLTPLQFDFTHFKELEKVEKIFAK
ncbi:5'/3'-nucleotidase SurE [Sporanaerobium hydrogeniformans]|uniref:5'/3'-nucleotidase SurE n=1 Tax=Sporanaerobium hydrogeniformans TaxID=3072179 RepID=A0AC61DEA6_9FIRM|nr:5'/3'-nucleotidase SurE [Sporanaerobium hydrogeniformans]PHV71225.1 5'/3'-nucleotidase SurE [Sporanaerobium hydrogeniformans]